MSIVTKTGDGGMTGLVGGKRVSKASARLHAYGTVDECNAVIGVVLAERDLPEGMQEKLTRIQHLLFRAGSDLATPVESVVPVPRIKAPNVQELEGWIEDLESRLPPQKSFILPAGPRSAALLHMARTICRRAERWVVLLAAEEQMNISLQIFLNRLSDLLFLFAREASVESGAAEVEVSYD